MRRFLIIFTGMIAGLLLIGVLGTAWLFQTNSGRQFLITQAETQISKAIGSDVSINELHGPLPSQLTLNDVTFADADGIWMTVKRVEIVWHPFRLLKNQVDISQITIADTLLIRTPATASTEPEDNQSLNIGLPNDLPHVAIEQIVLENFQSTLTNEIVRLDGVSKLAMGDSMVDARINLTSQDNKDNIDITLELTPDAENIFVDATLIADIGGVIDAFANLDGPLFINATGDSPTNDALVNINAQIADYGSVDAALSGNFAELNNIAFSALFSPGSALSTIEEFAQPISLHSLFTQTSDDAVLTITQSTSAIGSISGHLEWVDRRRNLVKVKADLVTKFDEAYQPELQDVVGPIVQTQIDVRQRQDDYAIMAIATSDRVSIEINEGSTNLKNIFDGVMQVTLKQGSAVRVPIPDGVFESKFQIDANAQATLSEIIANFDDGSTLGGDARYSFTDETVTLTGNATVTPAFIQTVGLPLIPTRPISGVFELSGPIDNFTARVEVDTPSISMGDGLAPPLSIAAAFAGLPKLPTGELNARSLNGDGQLKMTTRSSLDGTITIPELLYSGPAFQLNGHGLVNPRSESISVNATYIGQDGAAPWPGFSLVGKAIMDGTYSVAEQKMIATFSADKFQTNNIAIGGLELSANGTPSNAMLVLTTDRISIPQIGDTRSLKILGALNLDDSIQLTLNNATGIVTDTSFSLVQPSVISIDDGISIDDFMMKWGDTGSVALDGSMSEHHWRADLLMSDVSLPGADSIISLELALDTDLKSAAQGEFKLQSLLTTAQASAITGNLSWNQRQLTLASAGDNDIFDMRIHLPAILTRQPKLSIETMGAIEGYARYTGPVGVIAAYLPPDLQSLEGTLKSDLTIGGEFSDPKFSGTAALTDGAFTELRTGMSLADLHVEADADYASTGSIIRFSGGARGAEQSVKDTITLTGALNVTDTSEINLSIMLDNASLSAFPINTVLANGEINITGSLDSLSATGDITIDELDAEIIVPENTGLIGIDVMAYNENADDTRPLFEQPQSEIAYNLSVSADDRIFVRGRGLESEWSADIDIENTNEDALITGSMNLRRGWLDFSGRRFDLTTGRITFDRLSPNNPLIDIQSAHQTSDGVTAVIAVSGRAESPSVTLTSTPTLPSEDVMALVLFGKPAGELSALESLQTAQALASLGGIGPFGGAGGVTGSIREAIGLDLLNFDIDPENGGGSLTVGKYVADGFFVSATQDAQGETGAVRVEYEITDNISIESEIQQDGDQTFSANWKRDF